MRFQWRRSPRMAMLLVCGCSLIVLGLFVRNAWRPYADRGPSEAERLLARYEPLRSLLPPDETVRFVVDEKNLKPGKSGSLHSGARLFLAQYAVSPRLLTQEGPARWIVVDSDLPVIVPQAAAVGHWQLVEDLHNGVRLYRTDAGD
jgi:hypothetical protein